MTILFSGSDSEPSERPGTKTRRSDQLDYTLGGFIPFQKGVPCNVFVSGRTSIGIDFADALVR